MGQWFIFLRAMNEDWATVNINHLSGNALHFLVIREVVSEFLEDEMGLQVRSIQKTHLG